MAGWIKIHRCIIDSEIYQMPPLYLRVFERLILEANHKDKYIPYKEKHSDIVGKKLIKRGERLTSIRDICRWVAWYERGKMKEPNPRTVQNILDWLEINNMIFIYGEKGNRKETHYKVVNYNVYQEDSTDKVTEKQQKNNRKTTVTAYKQECIRMIKNEKEGCNNIVELKFNEDSIEYRLSNYLKNHILRNNPKAKVPSISDMDKWSIHIDRLMRLDGKTADEIKGVIEWCQNDSFWMSNILSTKKLREKFDTLFIQRNTRKKNKRFETNTEKILDSKDAIMKFLSEDDDDE